MHTTPETAPTVSLVRPDSMAWRIHGEYIALLGWGPAVLLQMAHPLVAAGVAQHSRYFDPTQRDARTHNTIQAMLDMTFGTPEEAGRATRRINAMHTRVRGTLNESVSSMPGGSSYAALDPDLLLWVQATTAAMMMEIYALFITPLSRAERDQYLAEVADSAPLLGVPPGMMPATQADLDDYFARVYASGVLGVGAEGTAIRTAYLTPPAIPILGGLVHWLSETAVAALLPEFLRAAYNLKWNRRRAVAFTVWAGFNRSLTRVLPRRLHRWPVALAAERRAASR